MFHRLFTYFVLVTLSLSTINSIYSDDAAAATKSNDVSDLLGAYYQQFDQVIIPDSNGHGDSRHPQGKDSSLGHYYSELLK